MIVYRNILKHSGIYLVATVITRLASLLVLPIYTRLLAPSDSCVLELLDLTSQVFAVLLGGRVTAALLYFHANARTAGERTLVAHTALGGAHLIGFAGAVAGWFLSRPLSALVFSDVQYTGYFRLVFLQLVFLFPEEAGLGLLRATNRSGSFALASLGRTAIYAGAGIVLLSASQLRVAAVLLAGFAAATVMALVLEWSAIRGLPRRLNWRLLGRLFRYGFPITASGIPLLVVHYGDRYLLQRVATLGEIGVYAIGYKFGMLVMFLYTAFNAYWTSQMFHVVQQPGGERAYVRTCTYVTFVLVSATVVLSAFASPLIGVLTASAFHQAAVFVPPIACAYCLQGLALYFGSVFSIERRTSLHLAVSLISGAVAIGGYLTLIPVFRFWGAVAATVVSFASMAAASYFLAQRVRAFDFEWRRLAKLALSAAPPLVLGFFVQPESWLLQVLWGAACLAAFSLLILVTGFLTKEEWKAGQQQASELLIWIRAQLAVH